MPFSRSKFSQAFLTRPICHRALHNEAGGIMENSLEAIDAAIEAGLPIEIDLQNTKDKRAVVFHDHKTKRLTLVKGRVSKRTLSEMEALPLKHGCQTISYKKLLAHVDGRVPILVEVKDSRGKLGPKFPDFLPDIIENTKEYQGDIALMSFNPYIVKALREALPDHPIGLITDVFKPTTWKKVRKKRLNRLREMQEIPDLEFDFISHNWRDLERVKTLGKPILCWTIKSEKNEKKAREIADNITFEQYMPSL